MNLIEWKDDLRIGYDEIDEEHEALVRLINESYTKVAPSKHRAEMEAFFDKVIDAVKGHFSHEETIMRERAYPDYQAHKTDHDRLLSDIADIAGDFAAGVYDYDPDKAFGERISAWFVNHIKTHDARLCQTLREAANA